MPCGCLLWTRLLPLLPVRLCSHSAQEHCTSWGGTAVSGHFPLPSLNSFTHIAYVYNAFTKSTWCSCPAWYRVQTQEHSSLTTSSGFLHIGLLSSTDFSWGFLFICCLEKIGFWRQRNEHRDVLTQKRGAAGSLGLIPGRGTTEKTAEGMQEALRLALLEEGTEAGSAI